VVTPSPSTFAAEMHQQGQGQGGYPYNAYHQQQGKGGGGRMGHRRSSSDIGINFKAPLFKSNEWLDLNGKIFYLINEAISKK
jgi:hypothetical protein